jgi:hypothetical protein
MTDRDAPLRMPAAAGAHVTLDRREVRRQLGLSLWLVALLGIAIGTVMRARPAAAVQAHAVEQDAAAR